MKKIRTITPEEATKRLRALGMRTSPDTIRLGLQQGVYPFGICIDTGTSPVYQIFEKEFNAWIDEKAEETDEQ